PTMPSLATMISSSSRCETLRFSRTGNWMFWRTVSEENSAPCWNRMPQRRSTARRVAGSATSRSTPNTCMRPPPLRTRPIIVRVRTDLPAPDGPTKPKISPRLTSRLSPSSTRVEPNCTVMSRTLMIASEFCCAILHPDRREEDRKNAVHDNDEEDAFHDRRGCVLAKRFGATLHGKTLDTSDDPDHSGHDGRLDHPDNEMVDRYRIAQTQQKSFRIDATIEPSHQTAAI